MPYISLDNLTQYNGRLRDYIDGSFDKLDGANWRKTSAAQSVSCWPIPESPLEPEVTFKFSETPPASGTKGPDNPSTIVGVESVSCNVCESEGVSDTPYSIDLGGTYYGGTVNFATGVLEVDWVCDEITSFLTFVAKDSEYALLQFFASKNYFGSGNDNTYLFNNWFNYGNEYPNEGIWFRYTNAASMAVRISLSRLGITSSNTDEEILAAGNTYIATHPLKIVYKTFGSQVQTIPITPVLVRSLPAITHYAPRQNTIYTPHESVQVGYAKSASKTSQDLANAIVALGGNV